jgi:hypothetical protein
MVLCEIYYEYRNISGERVTDHTLKKLPIYCFQKEDLRVKKEGFEYISNLLEDDSKKNLILHNVKKLDSNQKIRQMFEREGSGFSM